MNIYDIHTSLLGGGTHCISEKMLMSIYTNKIHYIPLSYCHSNINSSFTGKGRRSSLSRLAQLYLVLSWLSDGSQFKVLQIC